MSTVEAEHEVKVREICEHTDSLLSDELELPKPSPDQVRQMEATVKHLGSKYHNELRNFRTRCWQAEELGLKRMSLLEIGNLLEGKEYHKVKTWMGWDGRPGTWAGNDPREHKFEYFYDHRSKSVLHGQGQEPIYISSKLSARLSGKGGQRLALSRLPNLQDEVPYAALMKVDQFKELGLFNCFSIVGPCKAFRSLAKPQPEPIDPVLVGCIYNLEYNPSGIEDRNYVAYYPLAKW